MWLLENHFTIYLIIFACLAVVTICDGAIQANQLSQGAVEFNARDTIAPKNAPHNGQTSESKLQIGLPPSQLRNLNQATNHRQNSEVKEDQNGGESFHVDMESQKGHKAASPTTQYQAPDNNTKSEQHATDHRLTQPTEVTNSEIPLVENGIYWSQEVEKLLPKGLTDEQYKPWTMKVSRLPVIHMEKGTLAKCGRDGNAYAILSDGTQVCVRHSKHGNTGLLGELYAFYLSRLLQIHTVPAIVLSKISTNENSTWAGQRSLMEALAWADGNYVALIQWIPGLTEAYFPSMIQHEPYFLRADDHSMRELDRSSLVTLVDWTDLVIFDYITAHVDRMTIIYDAIRKTGEKWLMKNAIHNLARKKDTGALCIFDNECAFFASYPIMLSPTLGKNISEMYDDILGSVCIFRKTTVEAVKKLADIDDIGGFLADKLREDQISAIFLKEAFNDRVFLMDQLKERIQKVLTHIQKCQESVEGEF